RVAHRVGAALATGNAVVRRPASAPPLSALRVAADAMRAGLPAGRLNVVTGAGRDLGEALVTDPRVRMVTFTGGPATGEWITRTAGIKKISMELGSNSPGIVVAGAKPERALPAAAAGAFAQGGHEPLGGARGVA